MVKIAVIGDVHDLWDDQDAEALKYLGVDLVLFVGDIGNESVNLIRKIANLNLPKAIIMGNHDAWFSATEWGLKKCPYDRTTEDRVQQQLDILGKFHVGYGKLDFPEFELSVVGGRPFSWGGSEWKCKEFFGHRYNVSNFNESTAKIIDAVNQTSYKTIIFLAHNGPFGLGSEAEDICGKDWQPLGGDFGDPDLKMAIAYTKSIGKNIPLVTFGHMHHTLRHRKDILRTIVKQNVDTIYFNAASVPRIKEIDGQKMRNFSLVLLENNQVKNISLVWLNKQFKIISDIKLINN